MTNSNKVEMEMKEVEELYSDIQRTALPDETRPSNEKDNLTKLHKVLSKIKDIPWKEQTSAYVNKKEEKEEVKSPSIENPEEIASSTNREESTEEVDQNPKMSDAEIIVNFFGDDGEFIRFSVNDLKNKVITKPLEFIKDFR